MPPQTTSPQVGAMTPPPQGAEEFTDAQLSDGRTLRFKGQLTPDQVKQKVSAFRAKESSPAGGPSVSETPPSFTDWLLGSFGSRKALYQNKGLIESVGRSGHEAAEAESQKGLVQGATGTTPEIEEALAKLRASDQYKKAATILRKRYEDLTREEHGFHPATVATGGAVESASKVVKGSATPGNAAVAGVAAVAPPLRPFIGAYYAITGAYEALKPRNDDSSDPEFESEADYTERVLLNASQVAGSIALMKAPHRTPAAERQYRLNKATYAAGGGATEFDATLGDIDQTLKETKPKVRTVEDVQDVVRATERRLNQHFERALFPLRGKRMVPDQIANALEAKASQGNLQMTPEGRAEAAQYRRAAANYRQEWTLEKLDLERRRLFDARLAKKTSVQQSVSRRANVATDIDQIVEDNIRDLEYSELNARYPNQNFGQLKFRQAKLVELKDMLEKRVDNLRNAQAKQKGAPLLAGEHATGIVGKHGLLGRVTARIPGQGPETRANVAARKAFKHPGSGTTLPPLQGRPTPPPTPPPMSKPVPASPTEPPEGETEPEIEQLRRGGGGEPLAAAPDTPTRESIRKNLEQARQRTPRGLKRNPAIRAKVEAAEEAAEKAAESKAGTTAGAREDTEYYAQAKQEWRDRNPGRDPATAVSEIARRAQELKDAAKKTKNKGRMTPPPPRPEVEF